MATCGKEVRVYRARITSQSENTEPGLAERRQQSGSIFLTTEFAELNCVFFMKRKHASDDVIHAATFVR